MKGERFVMLFNNLPVGLFIPLNTQYAACNLPYHLKEQCQGRNSLRISGLSSSYMDQNLSFGCKNRILYHRLCPSSPKRYTASSWFPRLKIPSKHLNNFMTKLVFKLFASYIEKYSLFDSINRFLYISVHKNGECNEKN
jgi:hypothetical protein